MGDVADVEAIGTWDRVHEILRRSGNHTETRNR
jgi:hypothetical protein